MEPVFAKIISLKPVTHDVIRVQTEKPAGITFTPGQACDISLNVNGWSQEKRPFTFTCLPEKDYLEFTIKTYPNRKGVTNQLLSLKTGDELILHEVFGEISYKGEGVFIAGGAGITPFICIFRHLAATKQIGHNKLIFANKTVADIINKDEFEELLGRNFINILSDEKRNGYPNGFISEDFLKTRITDFNRPLYLCGPPPMMETVEKILANIRYNKKLLVKEAE